MSKHCENHGGFTGYHRLKEHCQICAEWKDDKSRKAAVAKAKGLTRGDYPRGKAFTTGVIDEVVPFGKKEYDAITARIKLREERLIESIDKANEFRYPTKQVDEPQETAASMLPSIKRTMAFALDRMTIEDIRALWTMNRIDMQEAVRLGIQGVPRHPK